MLAGASTFFERSLFPPSFLRVSHLQAAAMIAHPHFSCMKLDIGFVQSQRALQIHVRPLCDAFSLVGRRGLNGHSSSRAPRAIGQLLPPSLSIPTRSTGHSRPFKQRGFALSHLPSGQPGGRIPPNNRCLTPQNRSRDNPSD